MFFWWLYVDIFSLDLGICKDEREGDHWSFVLFSPPLTYSGHLFYHMYTDRIMFINNIALI